MGRGREGPKLFLGQFEGILQTDGYVAYDHTGGLEAGNCMPLVGRIIRTPPLSRVIRVGRLARRRNWLFPLRALKITSQRLEKGEQLVRRLPSSRSS